MILSKINSFFTNLNVVLAIVGWQFFSIVGGFILGESLVATQVISIVYRLFAFSICIIVLFLNLGNRIELKSPIGVLLVFLSLSLFRFIYDMYIYKVDVEDSYKLKIWAYMIMVAFVPILAILKSSKKIVFNRVLIFCYVLFSVSVFIAFFMNEEMQDVDELSRINSTGFSSIGLGHTALTTFVLAMYMVIKDKSYFWKSAVHVIIALIAILVMLRTGSRGPVLALAGIICIVILSKTRTPFLLILLFVIILLLSDFLIDIVLNIIESLAPNLHRRLIHKSEEGQIDTRMFHYTYAITSFLESPLIGRCFAIYRPFEGTIYAHNLFLDALMQLGIIGGFLMCMIVFKAYRIVVSLIKHNSPNLWVGLVFIQLLSELMVSSSYYLSTPNFSVLLLLLTLSFSNFKHRFPSTNRMSNVTFCL